MGAFKSVRPHRRTARTYRRYGHPTGPGVGVRKVEAAIRPERGGDAKGRSAPPPRQCIPLKRRVPTNRSVRPVGSSERRRGDEGTCECVTSLPIRVVVWLSRGRSGLFDSKFAPTRGS